MDDATGNALLRLGVVTWLALLAVLVALVVIDYRGSIDQWKSNSRNCEISQRSRVDVINREQDLSGIANDLREFGVRAAAARAADGDTEVAESYQQIASRAQQRSKNARERMWRAEARQKETQCSKLYPKPTLNPF